MGFHPVTSFPGRNKGKGKTLNDVNFSYLCYKLDSMSYSPRTGQAPWYIYPCLMSLTSYFFFWDWFSSFYCLITKLGLTLCNPINCSTPGLPVHHQLPEFTQTHVHWVSDAIQPSHPLSSPSPPALNPSQHQSLFQWVNSSHEVAKVLEFQL